MDAFSNHCAWLERQKVNTYPRVILTHYENLLVARIDGQRRRVARPAWNAEFPASLCSIDSGMASGTVTEGDAPGDEASESSDDDDDDGGDSDEDGPRRRSRKHPSTGLAPLSRGTSRTATATAGDPQNPHQSDRLLRLPEVLKLVPVGKSTWWAGTNSGRYPKPVKLSERCSAWRESEIQSLIERLERTGS